MAPIIPTSQSNQELLQSVLGSAQAPAGRPALSDILGTSNPVVAPSPESVLGTQLKGRLQKVIDEATLKPSRDLLNAVPIAQRDTPAGQKVAVASLAEAGQAPLGVMAGVGGAVGDVVMYGLDKTGLSEPVGGALKTGATLGDKLGRGILSAMGFKDVGTTPTAEEIKATWDSLHPEAQRVLTDVFDASNLVGMEGAGTILKKAVTPVRDLTVGTIKKGKEAVSGVVPSFERMAEVTASPEVHPFIAKSPENAQIINEAVKQGFEPRDIKFMTTVAEADKTAMQEMSSLAETGSKDLRSQYAGKRPADVVGDSTLEPLRAIQRLNAESGAQVDATARALAGTPVEATAVYDTVMKELTNAGVVVGQDGVWNFSKSIFNKVPALQNKLKQAFSDMPMGEMDAYDLHNFKKSLDQVVDYAKSKGELTGKVEGIIKSVRASADNVLDTKFEAYNKANTDFKATREVLDDAHSVMGAKTDFMSGNANMRVGQAMRQLFNNSTRRQDMFNFLQRLQDTSNKYGFPMTKNPVDQALYAQILEGVYGTPAITGLQGEVGKAIKTALQFKTNPMGATIETVGNMIEKARNITPEQKRKVLDMFIKSDANASPESVLGSTKASMATAEKASELTKKNGGATINLNGDVPESGFAYSPFKGVETVIPEAEFGASHISDFITKHFDKLKMDGNHLGIWVDDGKVYIDISKVIPDEQSAVADSLKNEQLALFDLSTFETKYIKDYEKIGDTFTYKGKDKGGNDIGGNQTVEGEGNPIVPKGNVGGFVNFDEIVKTFTPQVKKYKTVDDFVSKEISKFGYGDISRETLKYKTLTDFLEQQQRERNVLYRGDSDGYVKDNSFFGDFYNHAEDYAGGEQAIKDGDGVVTGFEYNVDDVYYFDNGSFDKLRSKYESISDKELSSLYKEALKDGRLTDALYQGNLTDKKALSVVKKILKGDENFSSITGDKIKTDLMVPLMQDFAKSKGRNIVSFEGNDFYGAQEYVVSDIEKLTNLNDIWSKTEKAKSQLSDVWDKVNSSKKKVVSSPDELVKKYKLDSGDDVSEDIPATMKLGDLTIDGKGVDNSLRHIKNGAGSKTSGAVELYYNDTKNKFVLIDGYHRVAQMIKDGAKADTPVEVKIVKAGYSDYHATPAPEDTFKFDRGEVKSFEDLVQRGTEYQPEFKNSVKGIADNLGFDVKVGNVKELQTLKDKALRPEEKGMFTPQSAKDVNRATIIVDSADDLARVQKEVANVYEITRVKNKFGDEYLYRSAILNVKTPLGHEAEIAVTTPKMWEAKITKGDALYKVVRAGAKGWEEAQRKMEELYKNAI